MATTNTVVVSGSSVITFPNFPGQHVGSTYQATATPSSVSESSFVFGKDAVVVFEFSKLTTTNDTQNGYRAYDGEVSGNSRLLKITVYENAQSYEEGKAAYYYRPQNADGTNLSSSNDRYGDTYLAFQTNAFASSNMPPVRLNGYTGPIPKLGQELFMMPSVDLYDTLLVKKQSFTYSNVTDVDYNGDGKISANTPEKGNGFFDGGHGNSFVEDKITPPPICFVRGSLITTLRGEIAVEDLRLGDEVATADNGFQPIRWIGARKVSGQRLTRMANLRPVRIEKGALGNGLPRADLYLSQQHRVLVRSKVVGRLTGSNEAFVAAKHLVNGSTITLCDALPEVEYFHVLFERHEVVFANGAATESLFIGAMSWKSLSPTAREEIALLFPQLLESAANMPVRPVLQGKQVRNLLARHAKNDIDLFAA